MPLIVFCVIEFLAGCVVGLFNISNPGHILAVFGIGAGISLVYKLMHREAVVQIVNNNDNRVQILQAPEQPRPSESLYDRGLTEQLIDLNQQMAGKLDRQHDDMLAFMNKQAEVNEQLVSGINDLNRSMSAMLTLQRQYAQETLRLQHQQIFWIESATRSANVYLQEIGDSYKLLSLNHGHEVVIDVPAIEITEPEAIYFAMLAPEKLLPAGDQQ